MRAVALMALVGALALGGCAGGSTGDAADGPAASVRTNGQSGWGGTPVRNGYPLPDQEFRDTQGRAYVPASDAGADVTLVFFGYTHCPDVCNVVLANIAAALRGSDETVRRSVEVLFVTTDPARDTPPVLREYLDRFDPAYTGLIAAVETVERAADDLHISYERPHGDHGRYEVEHGTHTTAFVEGRARLVWSPETSVAALRADLARLTRLASKPA